MGLQLGKYRKRIGFARTPKIKLDSLQQIPPQHLSFLDQPQFAIDTDIVALWPAIETAHKRFLAYS